MRELTSDRLDRWTLGTRLVGLVVLAWWAVFVPVDVVWTAVPAAVLMGSAVAAAALVRRPATPSLAQAMGTAGTPSGPPVDWKASRSPSRRTSE